MPTAIVKSAFRYPGSKEKIAGEIIRWFPPSVIYSYMNGDLSCYCEPFIGCGAIAVKVLPLLNRKTRIVIADKDPGIYALWKTIKEDPHGLIRKIQPFVPTVELYESFKADDGKPDGNLTDIAFRKFALHQMSFSGLGAKSGGPIGGKKQRSDYAVDCRYRPQRHVHAITRQHNLIKSFEQFDVYNTDFEDTLKHVADGGFAYLDPPYFEKGGELYKYNMEPAEHTRLSRVLSRSNYEWVMSYDDNQTIRDLYSGWSEINEFSMTATIDSKRGSGSRRKNNELVITKSNQN